MQKKIYIYNMTIILMRARPRKSNNSIKGIRKNTEQVIPFTYNQLINIFI